MDLQAKVNAVRKGLNTAINDWERVKTLPRDSNERAAVETSFMICYAVLVQFHKQAAAEGITLEGKDF